MRKSGVVLSMFGMVALIGLMPLAAQAPEPLMVLTVGGGPQPKSNQVAIESNVRYVDSILPSSATHRILFTDGTGQDESVYYIQPEPASSQADRACRILFEGNREGVEKFRKPEIRSISGPSSRAAIQAEFDRINTTAKGPVLLYFTGHGNQSERNLDDNYFGLWVGNRRPQSRSEVFFSVKDFAEDMKRLPKDRPVTLVMVQCFSGSFANLLFEDADPTKPMVDRPFCGFFAATRERTAAGCTPEINEADYHDFTSYFFAALTGKDRTGKTVKAKDYDKNGIISMTEAYYYAMIHEPSIDVPVATSDLFLRRFANMPDEQISKMKFSEIREMASPAQRDALDRLSQALKADGEDRLQTAYADMLARQNESKGASHVANSPRLRKAQRDIRAKLTLILENVPALSKIKSQEEFPSVRPEVITYLEANPELVTEILQIGNTIKELQKEAEAEELRGAQWLRLFRLAKTVVLERQLRQSGDSQRITEFDRLKELENRNPLKG